MQDLISLWIEEVRRYNERLHLVSRLFLRDLELHVLDCLELLEQIDEPVLADLGSGSGLPGIPYKLLHPASFVTLIERSAGKSIFLEHLVDLLGLTDIDVLQADPLLTSIGEFDAVISRAFSPQRDLKKALLRMLPDKGRFYYMATSEQDMNLGECFRLEERITGTRRDNLSLMRYTRTSA